jgi:hypothetical protein
MNLKIIRQAATVVVVSWAISAAVPAFTATLIDQLDWRSLPGSFEAGTDPDGALADHIFSITDDNLAIKFIQTDGATPDNVEIAINSSTGEQVVDTRSDDALIFFKLPAGDYTVEFTWRGTNVKRNVTLSTIAQSKLAITWDQEGAAPDWPADLD